MIKSNLICFTLFVNVFDKAAAGDYVSIDQSILTCLV